MHKNAYPIVLCYTWRDHFTPMQPSSQSKFLKWKLNKELGPIVSAALLVIEELDRPKLSPAVLTAVNQLEDTIVQTLPTISPTSLSSHLKAVAARNKAGAVHRGPVLQPGGEQVSSSDAHPALNPASTSANPLSVPDTDQPAEEPPVRRRGPKKYVCHHYGVVKPRKPDLTGHLWKVHREGEPIICERPPCTGQSFSTRAALKKHVESQHKKKWPYKCKDYHYGTRAKAYYVEHRISKHGARMVNSKTKEPLDYSCKKCKKICKGPASLQKHTQRDKCMLQKKFQCPQCLKLFKESTRRDTHIQTYHSQGGAKTWTCETCAKILNSLGVHINHQLWHRGLTAQRRARQIWERNLQVQMFKIQQKALAKKAARQKKSAADAPSKSAPPKLIPGAGRSPRLSRGGKGGRAGEGRGGKGRGGNGRGGKGAKK